MGDYPRKLGPYGAFNELDVAGLRKCSVSVRCVEPADRDRNLGAVLVSGPGRKVAKVTALLERDSNGRSYLTIALTQAEAKARQAAAAAERAANPKGDGLFQITWGWPYWKPVAGSLIRVTIFVESGTLLIS